MLELPDDWVWDFWTVDDTAGESAAHHLFFLKAPRSLGDPDLRHRSATIGHAVSNDLAEWIRVVDALSVQPAPAFDDLATWTGCIVRADDGTWWMFTSGISSVEGGQVQRIGACTSPDLFVWSRVPELVLEAEARWYNRSPELGRDEHWRDPWVVRDNAGTWHMYVTAQGHGTHGHGVVGHATSTDLTQWEVTEPLSEVNGRFDQLEVISVLQVDGRWVMIFSCLGSEMPGADVGAGGVWSVAIDGPGSRVATERAVRLTNERLYVGKVLPRPDGTAVLLAFQHADESGAFKGGVIDPVPVSWGPGGASLRIEVASCPGAQIYVPHELDRA